MHVPAVTDNYIGAKMLIQLHLMSLWTFNWPIHHLLVIWPGLQYITCSTYLQYIQCTAPLCNVTAALNVTMDI